MPDHLKNLFDQVLVNEPEPPDGDIAQRAMAQGRGIRRRRGLLATATAAALVAAAVAVNLAPAPAGPPLQVTSAAARLAQAEPQCTWPASHATDVSIFLREDITGSQRDELRNALHADPLVRNVFFESREAALEKFKRLWDDNPALAAGVKASDMSESFRLKLTRPANYPRFAETYAGRAGVDEIVGGACP